MNSIPNVRLWVAVGVVIGALATSAAPADVLYDTLWITDQATYDDANWNLWSGQGVWGSEEDARLADDFVVDPAQYPGGFRINSVTNDSTSILGNPPAGGVTVRILADDGGRPGSPIHEIRVAPEHVTTTPFDDRVFGDLGLLGQRMVVDTAHAGLVLAPGTYWLNTQPIDLTSSGDVFYQLRDLDTLIGGDTHWMYPRDGNFWGAMGDFWGRGAGTAAMRIEGVAIPGPAPALALCVWIGMRRRRR